MRRPPNLRGFVDRPTVPVGTIVLSNSTQKKEDRIRVPPILKNIIPFSFVRREFSVVRYTATDGISNYVCISNIHPPRRERLVAQARLTNDKGWHGKTGGWAPRYILIEPDVWPSIQYLLGVNE